MEYDAQSLVGPIGMAGPVGSVGTPGVPLIGYSHYCCGCLSKWNFSRHLCDPCGSLDYELMKDSEALTHRRNQTIDTIVSIEKYHE